MTLFTENLALKAFHTNIAGSPRVTGESSFLTSVIQKFWNRPSMLNRNLRKEETTMMSSLGNDETVSADFDQRKILLRVFDHKLHRGSKNGDFDVNSGEFRDIDRRKAGIFKGSKPYAIDKGLCQHKLWSRKPYTPTEPAMFIKSAKNTRFFLKKRMGRKRRLRNMPEGGNKSVMGNSK
jgi:hypothetical protein